MSWLRQLSNKSQRHQKGHHKSSFYQGLGGPEESPNDIPVLLVMQKRSTCNGVSSIGQFDLVCPICIRPLQVIQVVQGHYLWRGQKEGL